MSVFAGHTEYRLNAPITTLGPRRSETISEERGEEQKGHCRFMEPRGRGVDPRTLLVLFASIIMLIFGQSEQKMGQIRLLFVIIWLIFMC